MQTSSLSYKGSPLQPWEGLKAMRADTRDQGYPVLHADPPKESMQKLLQDMEHINQRTNAIRNLMKGRQTDDAGKTSAQKAQEQEELVKLRKEHKTLEENAQKVKNKIEMLKKNERRFLKNIQFYHSKAQEIEQQKRVNEQRRKEKHEIAEKRRKEVLANISKRKRDPDNVEGKLADILLPKLQAESELEKKPTNIRLLAVKAQLDAQKLRQARQLKAEKLKNEQYYKQQKEELRQSNQIRKFEVAKSESMAVLRLESHKKEKKQLVLQRLRREKSKEEYIIRNYQKDLDRLFQTHHQWVEKLKSRDAEEMQALEKYKKALNLEDEELPGFDQDKIGGDEDQEDGSYGQRANGDRSQGSLSEDVNQSVQ